MVYYTGDIHGQYKRIEYMCSRLKLTKDDIIVILGDVGANYYNNKRDYLIKAVLNMLGPTIFCIHGNHEIRPANIKSYKKKIWNGGSVWYEEEYPNLLFAEDGEIFDLEGRKHLVIGGAYSVDKHYRLLRGYGWWEDEQPSDEIKEKVERVINENDWVIDTVLSHTCPYKYEPKEAFLPMIDQRTVDASTEHWLGGIECRLYYENWYCGHWHIDKRVDKMHFLFDGIEMMEEVTGDGKQ